LLLWDEKGKRELASGGSMPDSGRLAWGEDVPVFESPPLHTVRPSTSSHLISTPVTYCQRECVYARGAAGPICGSMLNILLADSSFALETCKNITNY
jgi:hypothetical protein